MRSKNTQALLESIGANVRRRRERVGITQEDLAESAQLDRRYLQRVERGTINLTIDTLAALADALGATPASLLKTAKLPPVKAGRPSKKRIRED